MYFYHNSRFETERLLVEYRISVDFVNQKYNCLVFEQHFTSLFTQLNNEMNLTTCQFRKTLFAEFFTQDNLRKYYNALMSKIKFQELHFSFLLKQNVLVTVHNFCDKSLLISLFLIRANDHLSLNSRFKLRHSKTGKKKIRNDALVKIKKNKHIDYQADVHQLTIENMSEVIFTTDLQFNITYISPSIEKLLGYTAEEYAKMSIWERYPQEDIDDIMLIIENQINNEEYNLPLNRSEVRLIELYNKDNEIVYASIKASFIRDHTNTPIGIIACMHDITHQYLLEEKLTQHIKFQSIINSIAISYINLQNSKLKGGITESLGDISRFINADRALIFFFNYEESIANVAYEWVNSQINPMIDQLQNISLDLLNFWIEQTGSGLYYLVESSKCDNDLIRKYLLDHNIKSIITFPIINENQTIGLISFEGISTIHIFSEEELDFLVLFGKAISNIRQKMLLTDELIQQKEIAIKNEAAKSNLLRNISHEFRTPLNGILGFAEELKHNSDKPFLNEISQMIFSSALRLKIVLDSIMLYLDFEDKKMGDNIKLKKINLEQLLKKISADYLEYYHNKDLSFSTNISSNIIVDIDKNLFNYAILHLLQNANKFTDEGKIELISYLQNKDVYISVIDTGVGVEDSNKDKIFTAFFQASSGYNRSHEGIGIGLTLVKRIINILKGDISVSDNKTKGSIFTITIPQSMQSYEKLKSSPTTNINLTKILKPKVLIVEDNKINQKLAVSILNKAYEVDSAYDGYTAIEMSANKQYDVILMDIHLGQGLDGIETTAVIKKNPRYNKIPIIAVTGYTMHSDKEKIFNSGCSHYLSKPYTKNQLLEIIGLAITN